MNGSDEEDVKKMKPFLFIILVIFVFLTLMACARPVGGITATPLTVISPTPSSFSRSPTYPFGDAKDFQYKESDCSGTQYEMNICASGKAYQSARELDQLLNELDSQFPNGSWELALDNILLPQDKWESLKYPYCEYSAQLSIGGTIHGSEIANCVYQENTERVKTLLQFVCMFTEGFSRCPVKKPGGELPNITAIPPTPKP